MIADADHRRQRLAERLAIDIERLGLLWEGGPEPGGRLRRRVLWIQVSEAGPEAELLERCVELLRLWRASEREGAIFFTSRLGANGPAGPWEWTLEIERVRLGHTSARHCSNWHHSPLNPDGPYYRGY